MKEKIKFAFHIMTHPFDGFWDMKREKKGSMKIALSIFVLAVIAHVIADQVEAFLFNPDKFAPYDMIFEIVKYLLVFIIFCVANWSITTLMQGEGSFKDILMATGYSCLPLVIIPLPVAILSNVASFTESVYLSSINYVAFIWFFFLLFSGIMTIHQYSLGKLLGTAIVTVIAMMAIIFLCLLFYNLFSQLVGFIYSIYKEIALRS